MNPSSCPRKNTSPGRRVSCLLSCHPRELVRCMACLFVFGIPSVGDPTLSLFFWTLRLRPRALPCLTPSLRSFLFPPWMILLVAIRMSCSSVSSRLSRSTWPVQSSFILVQSPLVIHFLGLPVLHFSYPCPTV